LGIRLSAHALPCRHNLKEYLLDYIERAGITGDPKGRLFRWMGSPERSVQVEYRIAAALFAVNARAVSSQKPQASVHRLSVGEDEREIRIDQNQIRAGLCRIIILPSDASLSRASLHSRAPLAACV
jgi:hypothetical protein